MTDATMDTAFWAVLLGGLLAAILLAIAFLILRSAMTKPPEEKGLTVAKSRPPDASSLDASFRSALRRLGGRISGGAFQYRLPWVVLFGPTSGKKTIVNFLPNENAHGPDPSTPDGILWGFLRRGVLIKVPGSILPAPEPDRDADRIARGHGGSPGQGQRGDLWDRVLRQLTRRRPSRPLDAVVIAISADELMGAAADVATRGSQIRDKLNRLESGIGMVLPVYLLVTRCDSVKGFNAWCQELSGRDEKLTEEIFGWSNPHPVEAQFRPFWVDEAMNEIGATLRRQQLELFGGRNSLGRFT